MTLPHSPEVPLPTPEQYEHAVRMVDKLEFHRKYKEFDPESPEFDDEIKALLKGNN